MSRQFEQTVFLDKENTKVVAIGQTRDGIEEWITPTGIWERHKNSGIFYPPGLLDGKDVSLLRVSTVPRQLKALSFEQIDVVGLTHLTSEIYGNAQCAKIEVRDAQISYRIDGGAPTETVGHFLNEGDVLTLNSFEDIQRFTAININAYAILAITYFSDVI